MYDSTPGNTRGTFNFAMRDSTLLLGSIASNGSRVGKTLKLLCTKCGAGGIRHNARAL